MRKALNLFLLMTCFTLILPSCVSKKKWTELMAQKEEVNKNLEETQNQVANLESDIETLNKEKEQLSNDYKMDKQQLTEKLDKFQSDIGMLKKENEEMVATVEETTKKYEAIAENLKKEFSSYTPQGYSLAQEGQKLYVKGGSPIQFKSGSTRLLKESKAMLKPIAEMLKGNAGAFLLVEGHTDDVPMKKNARFASNEELSVARAKAVVRALSKMGVDKSQVIVKGHGAAKPVMTYEGATDMEMARSANRRADLALMISPSSLYKMGQTL